MSISTALFLAFAALQGPLSTRPAAPPALPRVSVEAPIPVWLEGQPLALTVTIQNATEAAIQIPAGWTEGWGLYFRELPQGNYGRAPVNPGEPMRIAAVKMLNDDRMLTLPAGARLSVPITLPRIQPPPGDAFEVLFDAPGAAIPHGGLPRIERVEDLRGARVVMVTDLGDVILELAPMQSPLACRNFVKLAERGFYDGVAFHRISKGLCVQSGDPDTKKATDLASVPGTGGVTYDGRPIPLERSSAIFDRGTVGLARIADPLYAQVRAALAQQFGASDDAELDTKLRKEWPTALGLAESAKALQSGSSQFFICTSEAKHFKGRYAAFAKVVGGFEVLDKLEALELLGAQADQPDLAERPKQIVRIQSVRVQRAPK